MLISILSIVLIMASMLGLSACKMNEPYLTVSGLKTDYKVGDTIVLANVKLYYYLDKEDEMYSEIDVTIDMISGFSTATPGTFKMTISYKRASTEIEYTVRSNTQVSVSETNALAKMQTAENYILSANRVELVMETEGYALSTMIATAEALYQHISSFFDVETWSVQESGVWYDYTNFGGSCEKTESETITNGVTPKQMLLMYPVDMLEDQTYIGGTLQNGIYTLQYNVEAYDEDQEAWVEEDVVFTISNNILTNVVVTAEGESESLTLTYAYNADAEEIPSLPVVLDVAAAEAMLTAAENYILASNRVQCVSEIEDSESGMVATATLIADENTLYNDMSIDGFGSLETCWTEKEGNTWYDYLSSMMGYTKSPTSTGIDDNPRQAVIPYGTDTISSRVYMDGSVVDGQYILQYSVSYYDEEEGAYVSDTVFYTIEDGILVQTEIYNIAYGSDAVIFDFYYGNDADEIPTRPTDVTWQPVTE